MWLYLGGALLLIAAGFVWCFKISMDPERVFWGAIEGSLATRGITVDSQQEANGIKASQLTRYSFGGQNMAQTITTFERPDGTLKVENLATSTQDFTRWLSIDADEKKADGSPMDFSKIEGVWVKGQEGSAGAFAEAFFGRSLPTRNVVVPFANLDAEKRGKVMDVIRDNSVYSVDFTKVKKQRVGGRMHYTYTVKVQTVGYLMLMKELSKSVGLHDFDEVKPEVYKGQPATEVEITVDARSRQVVTVAIPAMKATQTYLNHGVPVQAALPTNAITGEQYQKLLGDLQ